MLQFLANELIFEILRHFLPGLQLSVDRPDLFPWYLGEICSTWRTVFISSPQFWSTLDIDVDTFLDEKHFPNLDDLVELVQLALKRSNGHPLSLDIYMYDVFDAGDANLPLRMRANHILDMLVDHSIYWRDLCMILPQSCYPTLYRAKNRLPILRSMKLTRTRHFSWILSDSIKFEDLFTNAPQLSRVYFELMTIWRLNWSSVTVIHFVNLISFDEVIPVLRQTGVLEELVIAAIHGIMEHSGTSQIHLPFLKMLYIPSLTPLYLLHTPGLEELCVRHDYSPPTDPLDMELLKTIVSGYFKTICNLRKLAIYPNDMRHAFPVLEAAPNNIRELVLYGSVSKQLTFAANCPRLHNLETISIDTGSYELSYLLATIKAWAQEKQSTTEGGIGPFKNLAQFTLDFIWDRNDGIPKPVKDLKRVLEEQSIKFVSRIITESEYGVPPFEVF